MKGLGESVSGALWSQIGEPNRNTLWFRVQTAGVGTQLKLTMWGKLSMGLRRPLFSVPQLEQSQEAVVISGPRDGLLIMPSFNG